MRPRLRDEHSAWTSQAELRAFLREHRHRLPGVLAWSLAIGVGAFVAYGVVLGVLASLAPRLFAVLAPFFLLVLIGGREPAMLIAYQQLSPEAWPVIATVAVLGDLGMVLVGVPFYWWAFARLRDAPVVADIVVGLERRALARRRFVERWGPLGLAVLVAIPAWGTGVLIAGAVGLVVRLEPRRLLVTLAVAVLLVNTAWAYALSHAADAIPEAGPLQYLPALLLAAVLTGAVSSVVREHRRGEVVVPIGSREPSLRGRRDALARIGIREARGGVLVADCRTMRKRLALPPKPLAACRAVADFVLIGVSPTDAASLARAGVGGARDLALAPPVLVARALQEATGEAAAAIEPRAEAWREAARAAADADA